GSAYPPRFRNDTRKARIGGSGTLGAPPKDVMTPPCIHGFRTEECTSCRTCPHGLVTSRCGRCIRASSTPAGRKALLVAHGDHPTEERAGFEIVYVPELSGWQVRS